MAVISHLIHSFTHLLFLLRDEVLEARSLQLHRFEMARTRRERAREACDLLLISLYCHIPPGRGLEVRTLETLDEAQLQEPFLADRFRDRNIALLQKDGGLTIHLQKYKTFHSAGKDTIAVQVRSVTSPFFMTNKLGGKKKTNKEGANVYQNGEDRRNAVFFERFTIFSLSLSLQADSELYRVFKQFVAYFRAELHPEQSNDYLFLVSILIENHLANTPSPLPQAASRIHGN